MDDMEQKINSVLSDPAAMEKLMGVARSLGLGGKAPSPPPEAESHAVPALARPAEKPSGDGLGALLGGLQNMDPKMLSGLMNLVGAYGGGDDKREALLLSIKPYLRRERQGKLERAAQMMRIARTARVGLKSFLGGITDA